MNMNRGYIRSTVTEIYQQIISTVSILAFTVLALPNGDIHAQTSPTYACVQSDDTSYPVRIVGTEETQLNGKKASKRARKQIAKTKKKIADNKAKIKRLKAQKLTSKKAKNRRKKKLQKIRGKITTQKTKVTGLKSQIQLFKRCKNGATSDDHPVILVTEQFTVDAAEVMTVSNDFTVRATEDATVAGTLTGEAGSGSSITVQAGGDITVSGDVTGGTGSGTVDGGTIQITSTGGNVVLNGTLAAGNGAPGNLQTETVLERTNGVLRAVQEVSGGSGSNGGDIIVRAASGTVTVGENGEFQMADGGNGADLMVTDHRALLVNIDEAVQLENRGGDGGLVFLKAQSCSGVTCVEHTLQEDYPPFSAGDTVLLISDEDVLSGGDGGSPGTFTFSPTSSDQRLSLNPQRLKRSEWRWNTVGRATETSDQIGIVVVGARGGNGFHNPGEGQDVSVTAIDGVDFANSEQKRNGRIAIAHGGDAGDCQNLTPFFTEGIGTCNAAQGGDAIARGGNGGAGPHPNETGGLGGDATASAGSGSSDDHPTSAAVTRLGEPGKAEAYGGNGGKGGGLCGTNVVSKGGTGGAGGTSLASSNAADDDNDQGSEIADGDITSIGGAGGDGGDGAAEGGDGGTGGKASVESGDIQELEDGADGNDGTICGSGGSGTSGEKTITFTPTCPADGQQTTFFFDVYIPEGSTAPTHEIFDGNSQDDTEITEICQGATESSVAQFDDEISSGDPAPTGEDGKVPYRVKVTVTGDEVSAGESRPIRIKVNFTNP